MAADDSRGLTGDAHANARGVARALDDDGGVRGDLDVTRATGEDEKHEAPPQDGEASIQKQIPRGARDDSDQGSATVTRFTFVAVFTIITAVVASSLSSCCTPWSEAMVSYPIPA